MRFLFLISLILTCGLQAQVHILGRDTRDKVLPAFWAAGTNTKTTVQGINSNAGTNEFVNSLVPSTLSSKTLSGDIVGTNVFRLKTWDATLGSFQVYDFSITNSVGGPDGVIRSTGAQLLTDKTLNDVIVQSNATELSGILKGYGTDPLGAILGVSGTQLVLVQVDSSYVTPTNYLEFKEGVFTLNIASTNRLASTFWVTNMLSHGMLYTHGGSTAQELTNSGTYYTLAQIATAGPGAGMTLGTSSNAITVSATGYYEFGFQASFSGTASATIQLAAYTNNVEAVTSEVVARLNASGDTMTVSSRAFLYLLDDDWVQVRAKGSGASDSITLKECQFTLKRIY